MRFINVYGRYELGDPESWEESLGVSVSVESGGGGVQICLYHQFPFLYFLVFCGGDGVGGEFSISH